MRSPSIIVRSVQPSDFDRFSKRTEDMTSSLALGDWPAQSVSATYDDHIEITPGPIHPEGSCVFSRGQFVSDRAFTRDLIGCGNDMLRNLSARGLKDVTLFLRRREGAVEHYVADHGAESITWVNKQRPESLGRLSQSQERNILKEEYWTHMENFPGVRHVTNANIQHLKDVLSSLAIDSGTSDGSTSPFSAEQIQSLLVHMSTFGKCSNEYQTYATARLWNMIWHARTVNSYGGPNACLDRFDVLSESTPCFTGSNCVLTRLMLGAASPHLSRCSRTWAGRVAYVIEWRRFKAKNEKEWRQISELAPALAIASLLVLEKQNLRVLKLLSILLATSSAAKSCYLNSESQNLGDNASDAAAYFRMWELPEYNVQRLALRNAIPQALLIWAFIVFVLLVVVTYAL